MDLTTQYMGLSLKNPIVAGSSGLTATVEGIKNLEEHGTGAVVLRSVFEEEIMMNIAKEKVEKQYSTYSEKDNYLKEFAQKHNPADYLTLISETKKQVSIPVIASINCVTAGEWVAFAKKIQSAGADAIELNMFIMPNDIRYAGEEIEKIFFEVLTKVNTHTTLPIALKISPYFSGLANMVDRISKTNVAGIVLFNRFYYPNVDLENLTITPESKYSKPEDCMLSMRWINALAGKINCDLVASNGIFDGNTVLKCLFLGAKAVEVVSTLYKNGAEHIGVMLQQLYEWMKKRNYSSLDEIIGKVNNTDIKKPMLYERAQFIKHIIDSE